MVFPMPPIETVGHTQHFFSLSFFFVRLPCNRRKNEMEIKTTQKMKLDFVLRDKVSHYTHTYERKINALLIRAYVPITDFCFCCFSDFNFFFVDFLLLMDFSQYV